MSSAEFDPRSLAVIALWREKSYERMVREYGLGRTVRCFCRSYPRKKALFIHPYIDAEEFGRDEIFTNSKMNLWASARRS
mmetsp:Transcript_2250/g.4755  ORF Transcript_2250/g.4755 Transcript_2250/m.4755 type:complete len:80 (+) Transcript_2250:1187-1426(+)